MKKYIKWGIVVLLSPILLFLLLTLILYIPPVQNFVAQKAIKYASEETGMDISLGYISLKFPLDLSVEDFQALQKNDSLAQTDTIAKVKKLIVDVQLLPLFSGEVNINELELNSVKVNTVTLIKAVHIKGRVEKIAVKSNGTNIKEQLLKLNDAQIESANLKIALQDSVPEDTTKTENKWKIYLDKAKVNNSNIVVYTPKDSIRIKTSTGNIDVENVYCDLLKSEFKVKSLKWSGGGLAYDKTFEPRTKGLDVNHIEANDINLQISNAYFCSPNLNLLINKCAFKEKSGIEVSDISGKFSMDSTKIDLPLLTVKTPDSYIKAKFQMPLNAFEKDNPGKIQLNLNASIGKQDVVRFIGDMPLSFIKQYPNAPLTINGYVNGNLKHVSFNNLNIVLPSTFSINTTGYAENITNTEKLVAKLKLNAKAYNLSFINPLLGKEITQQVKIPRNISAKGDVFVEKSKIKTNVNVFQGGGRVSVDGQIDYKKLKYNAKIKAHSFPIKNILPNINISPITANIVADGEGFDFMSPKTSLKADVNIEKLIYEKWNVSGMKAKAVVRNGKIYADIDSRNKLLDGKITLNALVKGKRFHSTMSADVKQFDLYNLRITQEPTIITVCSHIDFDSDFNNLYSVDGFISNLVIRKQNKVYKTDDIVLNVYTDVDTIHARAYNGDFSLKMDNRGGYKTLLKTINNITKEVEKQIKNKKFDYVTLKNKFPTTSIQLNAGQNNILNYFAQQEGYNFKKADINIKSSKEKGLNSEIHIDSLIADSMQIDLIDVALKTVNDTLMYDIEVKNNKNNPQYVFTAMCYGRFSETGLDTHLKLFDDKDKLGIEMKLMALVEENGLKVHLGEDNILGYKQFTANEDNYIFLGNDKHVRAKLKLLSSDGTGLQIYSHDENLDALQDITFAVNKLDLQDITHILPYLPNITGKLDGDFHFVQTPENISVSSTMGIKNMTYEKYFMGNIGTEFVYMPKSDGSHYVDGVLQQNDNDIATISGTYNSLEGNKIDAKISLKHTPLDLVNGFIPDQIMGLKGYGDGDLTIKGNLNSPIIDGEVYLDSSYVYSIPYGIEMRFANDPVRIVGSNLLFENFEMFANNNSPLNISGSLDFSQLDKMYLDLRMRAKNFQLIEAEEQINSTAYGKAFVNFFGILKGRLDNLSMLGKIDVLGATDMTYVLKDSPLTTDNRLEELVTFTNFEDSTQIKVTRPTISGLNMDLSISIDDGARIKCDLNSDHSNYIDLIGGGDIRMKYNNVEDLRLTGKYMLANGEMKYSLPVIPLKTFQIQDGSYIEFTGNAMNPKLNIKAIERTKATVGGGSGEPARSVEFICGVVVTKTLKDMGLEFIIDAPEDLTISNELKTMSKEERGKIAVTMLTTGMYLADGNTGGFSMNSALSSFLQSEINNITGTALRSLDLSFGLDNTVDASGAMHTDYSFKFAKRFWNNRLNISVGGKVSSGSDAYNRDQSFFDNVTLEYRLSSTSNKYIKVFYKRDSYDWIEGMVGQYGVGFLWKRKISTFKDLFYLDSDSKNVAPMINNTDSVKSTNKINKGK